MNKYRNLIFYISTIGGFSALIYWISLLGKQQETNVDVIYSDKTQWSEFLQSLQHNFEHPLALLLAQIITIVLVARLFSWICIKIGQPGVIGEMIAGILLGPSFLGMYLPEFSTVLFPSHSLGNLQFLSQVGLILFMYIVGMEVDLKVLRTQAHDAVVISHASIILPFALGFGLAYFIYTTFAPAGVAFLPFALFIGIAMSITAFPVLARIVQERGIQKTKLGTVVITCAAADDITAWCILAAVIAIAKAGSFASSLYVIALAIAYVFLMIKMVRPFLKRIGELYPSKDTLSKPIIAIFLIILILSSYLTEVIGIHALFGAFMAGAIMPDKVKFREIFIEKVEDVAMILFLPLFFVFTGLRTQIGLLNDVTLWKTCALIVLVAVTGKFLGSAAAAKFVGQNWKDSLTIGALMNTRGLMELVVLNIGYDLGVLSPEIFSMMVIMALVTTFMTAPALDLINRVFKVKKEPQALQTEPDTFRILFSFTHPEKGRTLFRLAHSLVKGKKDHANITAMHITSPDNIHDLLTQDYEKEYFQPIIESSHQLHQEVTTLSKASNTINNDIIEIAEAGQYDLLLLGMQRSIYKGSILGKILGFTTSFIDPERLVNKLAGRERFLGKDIFDDQLQLLLSKVNIPVGIFIDNNLEKFDTVFVPVFSEKDIELLRYAAMLGENAGTQITIVDANAILGSKIKEAIAGTTAGHRIRIHATDAISKDWVREYSLLIISLDSWRKAVEEKAKWLSRTPSILIVDPKNPAEEKE